MADTPSRIVSLTPGSTETLCSLGLGNRLVGVDDDSNYPPEARSLPKVGRGMDVDPARIAALSPDLVVAYLGAPGLEMILSRLETQEVRTLGLTAVGLGGVMDSILRLGEAVGREAEAAGLVAEMGERLERVASVAAAAPTYPSVYWEWWPKPLVTAGRASWINDMIEMAGGANAFGDLDAESPAVDEDLVFGLAPEIMIACWCGAERMPEPERIKARRGWNLVPAVREHRVYVMEEGLFERPGPRLAAGLESLARMIHPELFR
jgi:iron complex transport system substrate-binding protein